MCVYVVVVKDRTRGITRSPVRDPSRRARHGAVGNPIRGDDSRETSPATHECTNCLAQKLIQLGDRDSRSRWRAPRDCVCGPSLVVTAADRRITQGVVARFVAGLVAAAVATRTPIATTGATFHVKHARDHRPSEPRRARVLRSAIATPGAVEDRAAARIRDGGRGGSLAAAARRIARGVNCAVAELAAWRPVARRHSRCLHQARCFT